MKKYDGSRQRLANVILDLELNRKSNKGCKQEITDIIQKISERETMTPHNDDNLEEMCENMTFYDEVNGGKKLNEKMVIEARRLEVEFFEKMGVYKRVLRTGREAWRQDDHGPMD